MTSAAIDADEPAPPLLSLRGLSKRYPNGVLANDAVSFDIPRACIHAVVGENGAGKSTLMKLLYGMESPDSGEIRLGGVPCRWRTPADAIAAGIGLVPQHLQLVASMTVAENLVLGLEPRRGPFFDRRAACLEAVSLARAHGLQVDPQAVVGELAAGAQQRVEILKALRRHARVLLLDEPTALLTPLESEALFASLKALAAQGLCIVLITHKLSEVRAAAGSFTVLRQGRVAGGGRCTDFSEQQLAELIVGRQPSAAPLLRVDARRHPPVMRVRGLSLLRARGKPEVADVSLDLAPGEILGIAGIEGNGQNRLADMLSGLRTPTRGSIEIDGVPLAGQGVRRARRLGVGCVPEDRLHNGVAASLSLAENSAALDYFEPPLSHCGWLDSGRIRERARRLVAEYGVRCAGVDTPIGELSGGNLQKVVMARELLARPRVLIACQPTRGVDVGAASELRRLLVALRDAGGAVLLVSADLDEVLALSDRIAVMHEGRLVAHFAADQVSPRTLGRYMTGSRLDPAAMATLAAPFTRTDAAAQVA